MVTWSLGGWNFKSIPVLSSTDGTNGGKYHLHGVLNKWCSTGRLENPSTLSIMDESAEPRVLHNPVGLLLVSAGVSIKGRLQDSIAFSFLDR